MCEKVQKMRSEYFGTLQKMQGWGSGILEVFCPDAACGDEADFFPFFFPWMEKESKDQADFFLPTFSLMKKLAKNQADGKCHRTSPLPPTVGRAYARVVRASRSPSGPRGLVEKVRMR